MRIYGVIWRCYPPSGIVSRISNDRAAGLTVGLVDLAYEDEQLRALCIKRGRALAVLGPDVAHELNKRIADVRAADSATDLLVGTRVVDHEAIQAMHISLANGFELVLVANHVQNPTTGSGKIDWGKVMRVKVLEISRMAVT